jgi:hypothetical protein
MITRQVCAVACFSLVLCACTKDNAGADSSGPSSQSVAADQPGEVSCATVVGKLASFNEGAGAAEKELWTRMCEEMPPEARACVADATSLQESQNCMSTGKLH